MHERCSRLLMLTMAGLAAMLALVGCRTAPKMLEVAVAVDYGPAARPAAEKTVAVPEGSTVFDALRAAFAVATSGR